MSANIYWKQNVPFVGERVPAFSSNVWMNQVHKVFGRELPCDFEPGDLPKIEALRDSWDCGTNDIPNPWEDLASAVEKYGSIRVWAEY